MSEYVITTDNKTELPEQYIKDHRVVTKNLR